MTNDQIIRILFALPEREDIVAAATTNAVLGTTTETVWPIINKLFTTASCMKNHNDSRLTVFFKIPSSRTALREDGLIERYLNARIRAQQELQEAWGNNETWVPSASPNTIAYMDEAIHSTDKDTVTISIGAGMTLHPLNAVLLIKGKYNGMPGVAQAIHVC